MVNHRKLIYRDDRHSMHRKKGFDMVYDDMSKCIYTFGRMGECHKIQNVHDVIPDQFIACLIVYGYMRGTMKKFDRLIPVCLFDIVLSYFPISYD